MTFTLHFAHLHVPSRHIDICTGAISITPPHPMHASHMLRHCSVEARHLRSCLHLSSSSRTMLPRRGGFGLGAATTPDLSRGPSR